MRISLLYGIYNKDSSIFYVNYVTYILYISKMYNKLYIHTQVHIFFLRELVVNY